MIDRQELRVVYSTICGQEWSREQYGLFCCPVRLRWLGVDFRTRIECRQSTLSHKFPSCSRAETVRVQIWHNPTGEDCMGPEGRSRLNTERSTKCVTDEID